MKQLSLFSLCIIMNLLCKAQVEPGVMTGSLVDSTKKALGGATVELIPFADSLGKRSTTTDKNGGFSFNQIRMGYYRLVLSYAGYNSLTLDSIYFRKERYDFNLDDIILKPKSATTKLQEVVIYAEKPLIQSKDGNITMNVGDSPLSASSNASELLQNVPLVSKDPDGKINVRGREPKILIDDKPVELNLQQLQDLLESMPGSSIERIEVMTNPPPQYANEQGGVINIVTKKGRVGKSGRISVYGGSRGDAGINGSYTYRKNKLALNINAGAGYNLSKGSGYSYRDNIYADSINHFNTQSHYLNKNTRPNFRANIDYDISKWQALNIVVQYNQNNFNNHSYTEYRNINRLEETYRLSERDIHSTGSSYSPSLNLSYSIKGKSGQSFKLVSNFNYADNENDRDFYQQYFFPDHTPTGIDSTQQQFTSTHINGYTLRANYDMPLANKKTFLSFGSFFTRSNNHVLVDADYFRKSDSVMAPLPLLANNFFFHQSIVNARASVKQVIRENFSITAGANVENTGILFELKKEGRNVKNSYLTLMPFANINRNWQDKLNLTLSYRRTIRRPGINELNPSIDFSDPYNLRFGNPGLVASTADNFDLVFGRTKKSLFLNLAFGYNVVKDIFSQVRTILPDSRTQITWENISGRKEYELSSWNGFTASKKLRINWSATYTYNIYSAFDKMVRLYRDGGSFSSSLNTAYTPTDLLSINGSFTINRFANPQGYAKWSTGMNLGIQQKLVKKKLAITLNIIDPFRQQQNRVFTSGPGFHLQSFSQSQTRNFRLSASYNLTKRMSLTKGLGKF